MSKDVGSLKVIMHARPINSSGLCSQDKSIFAHPKMITPSWPRAVRPFADGDDVATRGLSIGLLLASLFQDRRHNGPAGPLVANAVT
jgi:hypothetical protein